MEIILLERIGRLGHMGDIVTVKPGYARNFLLPRKKALRATVANKKFFEEQKAQLEADNATRRTAAEKLAKQMEGVKVVIIRQAGETGQLYGSVSARDISDAIVKAGFQVTRAMVDMDHPIKDIGIFEETLSLHPEVSVTVKVNVARSEADAKLQDERGKAVVASDEAKAAEEAERAAAAAAQSEELAVVAASEAEAVEAAAPAKEDTRKSKKSRAKKSEFDDDDEE